MAKPQTISKKRIIVVFSIAFIALVVMCFRVGWVQIVKGEEYSEKAAEQQTRDVPIEAKRGVIYDRNGKELVISATCYTLWARPGSVNGGATGEKRSENVDRTAGKLADILDKDKADIKKYLTKNQSLVKVAKYLDKNTADRIRKAKLSGIEITEDVKRHYPLGAFASHLLGSVTDDNSGLSGMELEYDQYLSGVAGRWIKNTDVAGNGLSYGMEEYYQAEDGLNIELTLDETLQHYVEKSMETVKKNTKADRVMCIMMQPKTGDILAMAEIPDFDPNNSKVPLDKKEAAKVAKMSSKEKTEYWNSMWRNFLISDTYEPGSTFKLLTCSIALEEGVTNPDESFYCSGSINVAGTTLKCWSFANPHGAENLVQAVGNSCNPVFAKLAQRVGLERYFSYLDVFGITSKTGIDFPGEGEAILQDKKTCGPVGLATMGYGQGIAVTPIQLITAVCSLGNDGKLMKPRLVKALTDSDGKAVKKYDTQVVRQVVSKKTADEMCSIMEYVVDEGGGGTAKIDGYRIGGKTGTADRYDPKTGKISGKTYSSMIAMAPMDDPQVAVLMIVDNPKGVKFGSTTAGPGVQQVLSDTLNYLNIQPTLSKEEKNEATSKTVKTPDVTGQNYSEAIGILSGKGLKYKVSPKKTNKDFKVVDQYPKAGEKINKGGTVYLYKE